MLFCAPLSPCHCHSLSWSETSVQPSARLLPIHHLPPFLSHTQKGSGEALPWDTPSHAVSKAEVELRPAERISVTFPDGTHSRIPLAPGQTLRQVLEAPYRNRGLSFVSNPPQMDSGATAERQAVRLDGAAALYAERALVIGVRPARSGVSLSRGSGRRQGRLD